MLIGLCRSLRLSQLLIELTGVVIAVVEVDGSSVKSDCLSDANIVGSQEFTILKDILFTLQEFTLGNA